MPTIKKPNQHFDATTYTASASYPRTITNSGGMQPDLVWIKSSSQAYSHYLFDSVRGTGAKGLSSNLTSAEGADAGTSVSSFNSNGYTISAGDAISDTSAVAWQWKAGGASTVNTSGTISSNVSVNTTAGFSVVTYTGTGSNATVGHGLGVAPKMLIVKNRGSAVAWTAWHTSIANTQYLVLNTTAAVATGATWWNSTTPTSSVISVGTSTSTNASANTYVAYCFAEVEGYSKFGSYTGNGSADGPFQYTGFRPRFIMIKQSAGTSAASGNWMIQDTSRNPFNQEKDILAANLTNAEFSDPNYGLDGLSNGFKIRSTNVNWNESSGTYIYMAFAEAPFKFSNAR